VINGGAFFSKIGVSLSKKREVRLTNLGKNNVIRINEYPIVRPKLDLEGGREKGGKEVAVGHYWW